MEPHRILQETHLFAQDVNPLVEAALSIDHLEQWTKDAVLPSSEPRVLQKIRDTSNSNIVEDAFMQVPDDEKVRRGGERVLQAPVSIYGLAKMDYKAQEVDEELALKDVLARANSLTRDTVTNDIDPYSKYGYPFENYDDMYNTYQEMGFFEITSPLDEDPMVTLDESELKDLVELEKIDGFTNAKEAMKEMDEVIRKEQS